MARPLSILWAATKTPWPPIDGGRRVLADTLRALRAAGHRVTLVAPLEADAKRATIEDGLRELCKPSLVRVRRRPVWADACRAQLFRQPWTVVRHTLPAVQARVGELLHREAFDLVQAEQVQALASLRAAFEQHRPVVLRAQNVESDLWRQTARDAGWRRPFLQLEARRLARREGEAVRRCQATLALTVEDAERLGELAGRTSTVHHVAAPFATELPAAEPLSGAPAMVLFGSGGWRPNAGGAAWFIERVWPQLLSRLPEAQLHVFGLGAEAPGVTSHRSPDDSRMAYPSGAILVVPLAVASGVRIKILEAWARGVPVLATPAAARGLRATHGEQLLLARDGDEFTEAATRLFEKPELAAQLVEGGRRLLRERHESSVVAAQLAALYEELLPATG